MQFELTDEQRAIEESVKRLCGRFDKAYWLDIGTTGEFPAEVFRRDGGRWLVRCLHAGGIW
jgi:hypothetical protein